MQQGTVTWVEAEQFSAVGPSGHTLTMDSDRQSNNGPGPMELLLLALGGCGGTDVVAILRKKRQQVSGVRIQLQGERAPDTPRVWKKIKVHFEVVGKGVSLQAVEHAIELSRTKYCSVSATLAHTAEMEWTHRIIEA